MNNFPILILVIWIYATSFLFLTIMMTCVTIIIVEKLYGFVVISTLRSDFNLPVTESLFSAVEVDANFHDGQTAEGETGRIVLEVYLLHGGIGRLVELQFYNIQRGCHAHHHVHATAWSAHLYVHVHAEEREYHV